MAGKPVIPFGGRHFPKVKFVRDKIREDAEVIYNEFRHALKMAVAAGEFEAAMKGYPWLLAHIPADEDGIRPLDTDVDKVQVESGPKGNIIQIGIAVGNSAPKQLSAEIIEIAPAEDEQ